MNINELINKINALEMKNEAFKAENEALKTYTPTENDAIINERYKQIEALEAVQDDKGDTPFFKPEIDGNDLLAELESFIIKEEEIDFSRMVINDLGVTEPPKKPEARIVNTKEVQIKTIARRHVKGIKNLKNTTKYILSSTEIEVEKMKEVTGGLSGATIKRLIEELERALYD